MKAGYRALLDRDIGRLAIAADHDRMSRRLNAEVIHELFAVGLKLQALALQVDDITVRRQFEEIISATDRAIHSVRGMVLDSTMPWDASLNSSDGSAARWGSPAE